MTLMRLRSFPALAGSLLVALLLTGCPDNPPNYTAASDPAASSEPRVATENPASQTSATPSPQLRDVVITGDTARGEAHGTFPNGRQNQRTVNFVRDKGSWLVVYE